MKKLMTVSLDLARKLKANGFPQNTYFWWTKAINPPFWNLENREFFKIDKRRDIPSPLAEEVLEELPVGITLQRDVWIKTKEVFYIATKSKLGEDDIDIEGETGADALAKMWLYLKENKLI